MQKFKRPVAAVFVAVIFGLAVLAFSAWGGQQAVAAGDTADEIKYSYGDTNDSVVFDWHGTDTTIYYGADNTYGQSVTASHPPVMPYNGDGNYQQAVLTGLMPDTTYHYKIGADGLDHTFRTIPTGDFTWVNIGDSMSTSCAGDGGWMTGQQQLIADQNPDFVTHGGDIAVPNQCGLPSLHQYFVDQQVWSTGAAFQPAWGNHEYGSPTKHAPADAITDVLSNYKGRVFITHAQTASNDTANKTKHPGCGAETGSAVNTCRGDDWGWFQAGGVLYISYPEPEQQGKWDDWQAKADDLMAEAQANPSVDFIVTYGHRPAYTSSTEGPNLNIRAATQALAAKYSPTASNPTGKYVLNVQHHAHSMEAFRPINGLTYITDAAGGQGLTNWVSPVDPNSVYRMMHFGILVGHYDASAHSLVVSLKCGADFKTTSKGQCTYGSTLWSTTFTRPNTTPQPQLQLSYSDGVSQVDSGQQVTYTATLTNSGSATASTVTLSASMPDGSQLVSADDGVVPVSGSVSWSVGDLVAGQTVQKQFTVQLDTLDQGSSVTSAAQAASSDAACQVTGSNCSVTDIDAGPAPVTPPSQQYITNPSFETGLDGWRSYNSSDDLTRISTDAYDGSFSGHVARASGSGIAGINSVNPWVADTTAGQTYTVSAYIHPQVAGQSFTLQIKELDASGKMIGSTNKSLTASSANWQLISASRDTTVDGHQLTFNIRGTNIANQGWFNVDLLSLTTDGVPSTPPTPPTPPSQPPTQLQYVTNQSVETDLAGWGGILNRYSDISRITTIAYDGSSSIQVTRTGSSQGRTGYKDKPDLVDSTLANQVYSASVWVRGQKVGQQISLRLRGVDANGSGVDSKKAEITVSDTNWHPLSVDYTAKANGNRLIFSVYSDNLAPGDWFLADMMSLTSSS